MSDSTDLKPQLPTNLVGLAAFAIQKYGPYAFGLVAVASIIGILLFSWGRIKPDIEAWNKNAQVQAATAETQRATIELQSKILEQAKDVVREIGNLREASAKDLAKMSELVSQLEKLYWDAEYESSMKNRGTRPGPQVEPEPLPSPR